MASSCSNGAHSKRTLLCVEGRPILLGSWVAAGTPRTRTSSTASNFCQQHVLDEYDVEGALDSRASSKWEAYRKCAHFIMPACARLRQYLHPVQDMTTLGT